MSLYRWECDACEESRPSSQMYVCNLCRKTERAKYFGACCIKEHWEEKHRNEAERDVWMSYFEKVNHMEKHDDE